MIDGLPGVRTSNYLPRLEGRIYAIAIEVDIESLRMNYGDPYNNAYLEIKPVLQKHGFA
jgi:hypothetical protein